MKKLWLACSCLILLLLLTVPVRVGKLLCAFSMLTIFHGFAEPHQPLGAREPLGGAAYLAEAVNRLRAGQPTLLLAAGDMIQGNNWANLFQGRSSIELMNAMKFDALVVGNHEFDYGQRILKERIKEARFSRSGGQRPGDAAAQALCDQGPSGGPGGHCRGDHSRHAQYHQPPQRGRLAICPAGGRGGRNLKHLAG